MNGTAVSSYTPCQMPQANSAINCLQQVSLRETSSVQNTEVDMNNFINITNNNTSVCTGEYFAVDKNEYQEVIKKETDAKGMITLGRNYTNKKILVFLSDSYDCIKKGNFILMSKKTWVEARQSKGKKAGNPLNVFANGTVWTYKPNMKALVFVRNDK